MPPLRVSKDDDLPKHCIKTGLESESKMDGQTYGNIGRVVEQRPIAVQPRQSLSNGVLSPQADKETSAVDAMLRLSCTSPQAPFIVSNLSVKAKADSSNIAPPQPSKPVVPPTVHSNNQALPASEYPYNDGSKATNNFTTTRKHREFTPDFRKDDQYWSKRRKNNDAAKRSREKRRLNDIAMGAAINELTEHNTFLSKEIEALKKHYCLSLETSFLTGEEMPPTPVPKTFDLGLNSPHPPSIAESNFDGRIKQLPLRSQSVFTNKSSDNQISQVAVSMSQPATHASTAVPLLVPVSSTNSRSVSPNDNSVYTNAPPHYTINQSLISSQAANVDATKPAIPNESKLRVSLADGHLPHNSYYNAQELQQAPQVSATNTSSVNSSSYGIPHSKSVQHVYTPTTSQLYQQALNSTSQSDSNMCNSTAVFHSHMKVPDISPISPESSCSDSSPRSLTISFTNSDSSDTDLIDKSSPSKYMSYSQNEPMDVSSNYQSYDYNLSRSRERKGIPHKLRHKMMGAFEQITSGGSNNNTDHGSLAPYPIEIKPVISDMPLVNPDSRPDSGSDTRPDEKYIMKRQKNNLAAQRCRNNRKQRTHIQMANATVLESENHRLKKELGSLVHEVNSLRGLVEKKKEAQAKGEPFRLSIEGDDQAMHTSSSMDALSSDAS